MTTTRDLNTELGFMRRLVSRAESQASRAVWRRAMQLRSTRISRVLHVLKTAAAGASVTMMKHEGSWVMFADGALGATVVIATPGRTLADLRAPLRVLLHREILRAGLMQCLVADGSIVIEAA